MAVISRTARNPLRLALWCDVLFEAVVGIGLFALGDRVSSWLAISGAARVSIGLVFLAAAVGLLPLALAPHGRAVRILAVGNMAAGLAGWVALIAAWGALEPSGRWLLGAASDAAILIGLAEYLALRRQRV